MRVQHHINSISMRIMLKKSVFFFLMSVAALHALSQSSGSTTLASPTILAREDFSSTREFSDLAEQWKSVVMRDKSNATAWLSWFEAVRFAGFDHKQKKLSPDQKAKLHQIAQEMSQSVPGSAEAHYANFLLDPFSESSFEHLLQAAKNSTDTKVILSVAGYAKIQGRDDLLNEQLKTLRRNNTFRPKVMEYNYNVLVSVPQNGFLFTHGDSDTYPLLMLQQLDGFRKDVTVINIEWLANEEYRNSLYDKAGVSKPPGTFTDNYLWVNHLIRNNASLPMAIGLTFPQRFLTTLQADLHCSGLVFSTQPDPDASLLRENWFQFRLTRFVDATGVNANYKVPLYLLDQHFANNGPKDERKSLSVFKGFFPQLFNSGK